MSDKWCRHFNGVQNWVCEAGVDYRSVRDTSQKPNQWPCLGKANCQTTCALYEPRSAEEIEEENRKLANFLTGIDRLMTRETDICPHCQGQVTYIHQEGRCVYGSCGCRLWQGGIPEAWK